MNEEQLLLALKTWRIMIVQGRGWLLDRDGQAYQEIAAIIKQHFREE